MDFVGLVSGFKRISLETGDLLLEFWQLVS
jgi:hypothetical protein